LLEEKAKLNDLWTKFPQENLKHGWTRLKGNYDKPTKTNNRSPRALSSAFEAIQNSEDEELAPLHKKSEEKELEEFQKKKAITSVVGHVGSIYPKSDGDSKENDTEKGDQSCGEDEKKNDETLALMNCFKHHKRMEGGGLEENSGRKREKEGRTFRFEQKLERRP
jgi:hypothetical protein